MIYAAAVLLGLAGSVHCLAMCGPLCLAIFAKAGADGLRLRFLIYHGARAGTYGIFGLIAGGSGAVLFKHLPVQAISIACGIIMIATALLYRRGLGLAPSLRKQIWQKSMQAPGAVQYAILGVLNAFLPCGLLVAALAIAASTGSALPGAGVMLAFGGSTVAVFALAGSLSRTPIFQKLARPAAIRGLACVAGLLLVIRGLALDIPYLSPAIQDGQAACQHCTPSDK
ncbi:MAG: sulfite exporter TauE/SafE [Rhodothermales bacterium]|jgi:sulfite exporter TauE/SafE